jgi:hypothetical protein
MKAFHWKRGTGAALVLLAMAGVGAAATQGKLPSVAPKALAAATGEARAFTLTQLGLNYAVKLRGLNGSFGIPFGVRADELITSASLSLNYAYSASSTAELSHLKVSVNDVQVMTLPLDRANAGTPQTVEIPIDRRLITDSNRINVELVNDVAGECVEPTRSSQWATIDASSTLVLRVTPLNLTSDLATLPQPFFDRRDVRRVSIPFVFGDMAALTANATTTTTLGAAGIVSSWFGALADYRGAAFPVSVGELPASSHAVVFATPQSVIAGLTLPTIQGPTVRVMNHPRDPAYKLLLVMGRTAAELKTAASALVLNSRALTGSNATITDLQVPAARKPHDAPRWLASNRSTELGELAPAADFAVSGYTPDVVKVNLHLPPDLFTWRSRGIPLDLHYRYTPKERADQSTLNLSVNETFITSMPLRAAKPATDTWWSPLAARLMPDSTLPQSREVHLPPLAMGSRSQLRLHYYFERPASNCQRATSTVNGNIDPKSTIDVSGFPHYIAMPELATFANSGFPFTRMADLSETAVVMPERAERGDVETYLAVLGQIGNATGYPALRVTVGTAPDVAQWADKDLLVLGSLRNQPLFTQWAAQMPLRHQQVEPQPGFGGWLDDSLSLVLESRQRDDLQSAATQVSGFDERTDAVVAGFQSPLRAGRSVVAVVANATSQQSLVNALLTPDLLRRVQGSMSIIRGATVGSSLSGETYYVGRLPPVTWLQWTLSRSPLLLGGLVLLVALLGAMAAYASLQMRAHRRLS